MVCDPGYTPVGVTFIYHIAAAADWERAVRDGQYTMSTRGLTLAEQGFIHASTAAQVALVANAFYRDVPDLLLLVIDTERGRSRDPVRARARPGLPYPHIYGPLQRKRGGGGPAVRARARRPVLLRRREVTGFVTAVSECRWHLHLRLMVTLSSLCEISKS